MSIAHFIEKKYIPSFLSFVLTLFIGLFHLKTIQGVDEPFEGKNIFFKIDHYPLEKRGKWEMALGIVFQERLEILLFLPQIRGGQTNLGIRPHGKSKISLDPFEF